MEHFQSWCAVLLITLCCNVLSWPSALNSRVSTIFTADRNAESAPEPSTRSAALVARNSRVLYPTTAAATRNQHAVRTRNTTLSATGRSTRSPMRESGNKRVRSQVRPAASLNLHLDGTQHLTATNMTRATAMTVAASVQGTQRVGNKHGAGAKKGNVGVKKREPIGQAPKDDHRQIFLREALVLLSPGQFQLDSSLSYAHDTFSSLDIETWTNTVRVGLPYRSEIFLSVPLGGSQQEFNVRTSAGGTSQIHDNISGIGDVEAGLNFILRQESAKWPNIIGSVSLVEPFGESTGLDDTVTTALFSPEDIAFAQNRRNVRAGLTFVRSSDPAVLFGGVDYGHFFSDSINGMEVEGGHQFIYSFGAGFAVNDELTFSTLFQGVYQTQTTLDGEAIQSSRRQPWTLQSSLSYAISPNQYIEPTISYGLNDEAVDGAIGLSYVHTF